MAKTNTNFKKGSIELIVLSLLKNKPLYGYELIQLIFAQSDGYFSIPEGALYPILYKLEEKGHISSERKIVGKRLRTYYYLENSGVAYLDELMEQFQDYNRAMEKLLTYKGENTPDNDESVSENK